MRNGNAREPAAPVLHAELTLVEVSDPLLLAELKADARIGPLLVGQLSDRIGIVSPSAEEQFVRALLKAGHTPKVKVG